MTLSGSVQDPAQGGLESVGAPERVGSLTGIRALAALLVVLTHAAYTTGKYPQGYLGLVWSRAEIGVPIFFVLSGFLLFRPWVKAAATGAPAPSVRRYAWHRVRRIMPAYVVTVLIAYLVYHFRTAGPNPGHTWEGLFRNLTLTQIYADNYLYSFLHQGLTQMWSLAVEAAFYVVLPLLAYVLLVLLCRRRWRPGLLMTGLVVAAAVSPVWLVIVHHHGADLPDGARLWLPTYLAWFVAGMMLAVLGQLKVRGYAMVCVPLALVCYFIASTPIAGEPTTSPAKLSEALFKTAFYAVIAALLVAPPALGDRGWYTRFLASRPMVFLGEISYEIFLIHLIIMELVMVEILQSPVYTGSMFNLFVLTMAFTIPASWLLHRFTRVRS
ncbi:acyltransferase family protein [Mycolicibacterium smegmatis]|uniref:Acyltransferase 3 n=2 Tax=Mycolicibacterium smegmatis (strain ATCC 700084 / mc(2)155) TaxID=246196 RepID=I7FRH1_MYCS2|nr:acyltransferase [Mycolicibacterium smegmatis]ABK74336.1 probable acyltransferase [Mycolicibacterium smegmatis MC2 155]AFP41358.1 Acyltransferase 3 [Mycolicibacterium smegmatis MC2 155]AIU10079.1 acyltransferase [Mycolicibacterium smegmatis MC2 155]AIU16704.1 acyltransferase [Mycolicibacterium smegmatis]AIU23327.1 acyltransferase [Mycolicibacterium smegmatis]